MRILKGISYLVLLLVSCFYIASGLLLFLFVPFAVHIVQYAIVIPMPLTFKILEQYEYTGGSGLAYLVGSALIIGGVFGIYGIEAIVKNQKTGFMIWNWLISIAVFTAVLNLDWTLISSDIPVFFSYSNVNNFTSDTKFSLFSLGYAVIYWIAYIIIRRRRFNSE